jgi:hypothetical protein
LTCPQMILFLLVFLLSLLRLYLIAFVLQSPRLPSIRTAVNPKIDKCHWIISADWQ